MTIDEVISRLQTVKLPGKTPVVAEWNGAWSNLKLPTIQKDDLGRDVIVFDVKEYGTYKRLR